MAYTRAATSSVSMWKNLTNGRMLTTTVTTQCKQMPTSFREKSNELLSSTCTYIQIGGKYCISIYSKIVTSFSKNENWILLLSTRSSAGEVVEMNKMLTWLDHASRWCACMRERDGAYPYICRRRFEDTNGFSNDVHSQRCRTGSDPRPSMDGRTALNHRTTQAPPST